MLPPTFLRDATFQSHVGIIVLFGGIGAAISRPENRAGSALAGRPGGRAGEQPLRSELINAVTVTMTGS